MDDGKKKVILALLGLIVLVLVSNYFFLVKSEVLSTQSENNFTVTFYNCDFGLTENSCYVDVQNLEGTNRQFNLSILILNTSYPANQTDTKLYEKKIMQREFPVYDITLVNQTCYIFDNLTNSTTSYDCSYNSSIQTGIEIKNITELKDMTGKIDEKNSDRIKNNYGKITIPKFNSKETIDNFGNIETVNGTKTFKIVWTTPIIKSESGWGSIGQIVIVDENTGVRYE